MNPENAVATCSDISPVSSFKELQVSDPYPDDPVMCLESSLKQPGLLADAYTSDRYLQQERQTVFSRYWVCVGLASDLPNPGDVYPTEVAGMPIVLVRDGRKQEKVGAEQGSTLRAFHNICSHRGLQLVKQPCNVQGHLRCPYHSWAYKLDGSLKSTP
ncbi:MAG: Rieske (2Fe-2S) protein, partial [Leptolyngbya sp. SIO1D8]|nr:Rieske (2Fe-2S) protein [Leptolyngbya sp. SIO1D8]